MKIGKAMKKAVSVLLISSMGLSLAACGGASSASGDAKSDVSNDVKSDSSEKLTKLDTSEGMKPSEPVKITFWHSASGSNGEALDRLVDEYNAGQGKENGVSLEAIFQGPYDDASTKLSAVLQADNQRELPDIMQMSAKGIFDVKESKYLYPVQKFIDADKNGINVDDLNVPALKYGTYMDDILGLPFSNSSAILAYNKEMFKEAGINPDIYPETISQMADYIEKLTQRDGDKIKVFGLGTKIRLFLLSTWIPMQGEDKSIFDNENGRGGTPTEIQMTKDGSLKKFLQEWQKVAETGSVDYQQLSPIEGFQAEEYAMCMLSTSNLSKIYSSIQDPGTFDVGICELPRVDDESNPGTSVGGSAVYTFDKGDSDKLLGAWDFLKYLATPEVSAQWFMETGYYPMNNKAFELPETTEFMEEKPLFNIVKEINEKSTEYPDYFEPWIPSLTDIDTNIQDELIKFTEGSQDIDATISAIDEKSDQLLQDYNDSNF